MSEAAALLRFIKSNLGLPFTPIIAGGFARDQILGLKPRDIDVFLLRNTGYSVHEAVSYVVGRLDSFYIPHLVETKNYHLVTGTVSMFGPSINFQFMQWPVQLIATPCAGAEDVVSCFDYDVCQFWLGEDESGFGPIGLTPSHLTNLVHRDMRLLHTRTPWSSLRRGILMADRFGFKFLEGDKRRLIEALHAEQSA